MSSPNDTVSDISTALADGACLVNTIDSGPSLDLQSSLVNRLSRYYFRRGSTQATPSGPLEKIQLVTATEALSVVRRVQKILSTQNTTNVETTDPTHQAPLIGTRDLAELRTLLSMAFKWGIDPLISSMILAWPNKESLESPKTIDLTTTSEDYAHLSSMVSHVMDLLFPGDLNERLPDTLITTSILHRHLIDLLRPCIILGWLPRSLASASRPPLDAIRPRTMRLLNLLPPAQIISALGGILSSSASPPYARKTCSILLSQQLLRPQGVQGLCAAVFGEGKASTDEAPIEKLEHVVRVLTTTPGTMKAREYFQVIIPRIIGLLLPEELPVYRRAAAFSVSRMLSMDGSFPYTDITSDMIFNILHRPFQEAPMESAGSKPLASSTSQPNTVIALHRLITLTLNIDPSPNLISALLTPITPTLYSLLHHFERVKTSDPGLKESLRGLLVTWGKIVDVSEVIDSLWVILESGEGQWQLDSLGQIHKIEESKNLSTLSLMTPADFRQADEAGGFNIDTNILNLYPDPVLFVQFLKTINRPDVSSEIFVKLLEGYRDYKTKKGSNPMRTLLYLQIIMQMQTQILNAEPSSNILSKPTHLLAFIKHILEPAPSPASKPMEEYASVPFPSSDNYNFPSETYNLDEDDSDDDTPGADVISVDDDMFETSINLLLSILEANEGLSARTTPILDEIFSLLEPLTRDGSPAVKPLAREARMVMTARLASTSRGMTRRHLTEDSAEEIYQKALKLLQDPILPVRAHGLLLLRQLVSPDSDKKRSGPRLDNNALVPAILSIFLQSICDDDSYMFLNAIQGLAAMVDTFGKEVLQGLMKQYTEGLEGLGSTNLTQNDVDTKIRIGEALGLVIRRCGEALGIHADVLVPPLYAAVRSHYIPTVLRASSLSLLAECESAQPLVMVPYIVDLASAMIDLLQVETVSTQRDLPVSEPQVIDTEPTSTNSKVPPLRRAALNFLGLLFRETTKQIYHSSFGGSLFPDVLIKRAKTTLSYIASTDQDAIVRVMAREANENLNQMQQARMGM